MKLHDSNYLTIEYVAEPGYFINTWHADTQKLKDESFKEEVGQQASNALKHKPKAFLTDARNFLFPIHPELQEWVNENIFRDMRAAGVSKLALLISSDLIAQLGIEQLIDDDPVKGFVTHYFDDKDKAIAWICE
jgi:hypothetical protein